MNGCKYRKNEIVDGIKHELCTNVELKELNKSEDKDIPCIQKSNCRKYKEDYKKENEVK